MEPFIQVGQQALAVLERTLCNAGLPGRGYGTAAAPVCSVLPTFLAALLQLQPADGATSIPQG